MSNSQLVNYTLISPHKSKREKKIRKITWHHMAGNLTVQACGQVFQNRQASTNYGVSGKKIGLYVPEDYRAWSTANPDNDHQAINMELANDGGTPNWHVSDETIETAITLTVDCCKRNGIAELKYTGDASGTFTTHDMFMATTCPGPYLKSKMAWACAEINKRLKAAAGSEAPEAAPATLYRVRKSWEDAAGQLGAFEVLDNAKAVVDKNPGYKVFDPKGVVVYPEEAKAAAARGSAVTLKNEPLYASSSASKIANRVTGTYYIWSTEIINGRIRITNSKANVGKDGQVTGWISADATMTAVEAETIQKGDKVEVINKVDWYGTPLAVSGTYDVLEVSGKRVVIGKGNAITAAIHMDNLKKA